MPQNADYVWYYASSFLGADSGHSRKSGARQQSIRSRRCLPGASAIQRSARTNGERLAGLSYALFIFGFKYAAPHGSPQAILVIAFAALVAVLIWPNDFDQTVAVLSTPAWPLFITLGVLGAGLSFFLYIIGLRHTEPAVASIVAMIEPVTASLFGLVVLNASLTGLQLVGMGLISVSVTGLSVYSSAQWRPSDPTAQ